MSVYSPGSDALVATVYSEYARYERYLAMASGLALLPVLSLLLPHSAWGGCLGLLVVLACTFRKYHVVVHRFVGNPSTETDHALQLWGTAAQASVWAAVPIVISLLVLQLVG